VNHWRLIALALTINILVIIVTIIAAYAILRTASAAASADSSTTVSRKLLPRQVSVIREYRAQVTAYTIGDGSGYYAADGTRVARGVAACPFSWAFGTKFRVPSLSKIQTYVCHDRSAFKQGLVDLWVPTLDEAFKIGRSRRIIELISLINVRLTLA